MMENSAQREINLVRLAEFIEDIRIYRVTEDIATIYGQTQSHFDQTIWSQRKEQAEKN